MLARSSTLPLSLYHRHRHLTPPPPSPRSPPTYVVLVVHSMCASSSSCVRTGTPLSVGGATKGLSLSPSLVGGEVRLSVGKVASSSSSSAACWSSFGGRGDSPIVERGRGRRGARQGGREGGRHSPIHRNRRRRRKPAPPPPPPLRSNRGRRGDVGLKAERKERKGRKGKERKKKKRRFGLGEGGGQKRLCSPLLIASTVEAGVVEELFRFPPLPPPRKKREPD